MATLPPLSRLVAVRNEYLAMASEARVASDLRLLWLYRRLVKQEGEQARGRLLAVVHEMEARDLDPPTSDEGPG